MGEDTISLTYYDYPDKKDIFEIVFVIMLLGYFGCCLLMAIVGWWL